MALVSVRMKTPPLMWQRSSWLGKHLSSFTSLGNASPCQRWDLHEAQLHGKGGLGGPETIGLSVPKKSSFQPVEARCVAPPLGLFLQSITSSLLYIRVAKFISLSN
ncbi:unnamed protein product [Ilex paraguariensis]